MLVTGGRGFIGTHLVSALARARWDVTSVDVAPLSARTDASVREVVLDIRDADGVARLFREHAFETVFDLAACTEVGLPKPKYQRNIDATRTMIEAIGSSSVRKYIFFSTQFVFRKPDQTPASEEDFFPVDNYAASKVASERAIRASLPSERYLILRPTYIWGPGLRRFKDGLLYRLAKGQLLISSNPAMVRYYGYVKTAAAQAMALARLDFAALPRRVYYLSDDAVTLREFCAPLIAALGQGRAIAVPPALIRGLGVAGSALGNFGLTAPINMLQARELTRNYPVPIAPTIEMTHEVTDLYAAAAETVAWAKADARWLAKIAP